MSHLSIKQLDVIENIKKYWAIEVKSSIEFMTLSSPVRLMSDEHFELHIEKKFKKRAWN